VPAAWMYDLIGAPGPPGPIGPQGLSYISNIIVPVDCFIIPI
jgi:hypothetical protein